MNQLRTTDPEPVGVTSADGFELPASVVAVFIAVLILAAVGCHFISADSATTAALKVVSSTLALAVVPGALITLLWRVRPRLHVLELLGFAIALSFGAVHLLTIVAVSIHASPNAILIGLGLTSFVMIVRAVRAPSTTVVFTMDELIVLGLLVGVACLCTCRGSPFDVYEDRYLSPSRGA